MNLHQIPLLDVLRQRMEWLNARQGVLSQNVANADTPGYMARDVKPMDFESVLQGETRTAPGLTVDNPHHIAIAPDTTSSFENQDSPDTEANPTGNTVSLEEEMIKVADVQGQYAAATNLYAKMMRMMRTAVGAPQS
ncbi:MAG TPA: flagellar basal body rod protein FlgB [Rhizomicrobium sp.]|nr:flagellar basal body rod protein FlgB [Rhizomicrobium sp.]